MRVASCALRRFNASPDVRYLTAGQIRERFGVSDMWIVRRLADANFPKPIRFGGRKSARHWRIADIEKWEVERACINSGEAA